MSGIFTSMMLGGCCRVPEFAVQMLLAAFPYLRLCALYAESFTLINSVSQLRSLRNSSFPQTLCAISPNA